MLVKTIQKTLKNWQVRIILANLKAQYPDLLEYTYNTFMHDCRRKIQWKAVPKTEQGKT